MSCKAHQDCPPSQEKIFDEWWKVVGRDTAGMSVKGFLTREQKSVSNTDFQFDASKLTDKSVPNTKFLMRTRLERLYEEDDMFQKSVAKVVHTEDRFPKVFGMCENSGRCKNSKFKASSQIFDGSRVVTLLTNEDGTISVVDSGSKLRSLWSQRCDVDAPPELCDSIGIQEIEGNELRPGDHPVVPIYKVSFPEGRGEYLVNNAITVLPGDNDDDTRKRCAEELCTHNEGSCPAPFCVVSSDNLCVPNNDRSLTKSFHMPRIAPSETDSSS